jgi:glutamyl endopeptidase
MANSRTARPGRTSRATATRRGGSTGGKRPRRGSARAEAGAAMPTPTGPHSPISNFSQESAAAGPPLRMEPSLPETVAILDPAANGIEAIQPKAIQELGAAELREPKALPDIGRAAFADPMITLETVHGPDNRVRVTPPNGDPASYPWCINAFLLITARDGSQWMGTAWFISSRTLVTAAHCVYIKNSGLPTRDGWVKSIQVMPGRDGQKLPYGSITSTQFWTVQGWADSGDENFDYGAIVLPAPPSANIGTIGFELCDDATLSAMVVNVAGYPGDMTGNLVGTLWYDNKQLASVTATKVYYDIDTAGGQSGAAVYRIDGGGHRVAVAVHAYGGPTTNSGTRITAAVFANLKNWSV